VQENESIWLKQAQEGDQQAFVYLVEAYQNRVYNLCYRMLMNAEDAEDAAQETFLRAYKAIKRYDNRRPFATWLLSISAHYCIDQIRKRRVQVISVEELPVPDLPDKSEGIEHKLSLKERQREVQAILKVLDPVDRASVVMYYWYDFSYKEICQALSLSESAIKSRLHRARRAMAKEWLNNHPDGSFEASQIAPPSQSDKLLVERMTP